MKSTLSLCAFLVVASITFSCTSSGGIAPLTYTKSDNGFQTLDLQDPLLPEQTLSRLTVPEGFEIHLFASEPDISNPIALAWDEKGRLWVVESTNYPHEYIGTETGTDRITICEDTNGDGKADKFIRFAENQPLSTAIVIVKGGALVGQAPDIVFMEDVDGDDKFDRKTPVVDDAFGSWDTHAVMNNFKYGIDNRIWSAVGYSGMYEPGTAPAPGSRENREGAILPMGVFRFMKDGSQLEPIGRFNNNTWGLAIGEDNNIFGSTANNNHAITVGIPMRFEAEKNVENVQSHFIMKHSSTLDPWQVDYRDGYTAVAGAFMYNGRRYPRKYWGAMMINEPTGHVVHPTYMEAKGAAFAEKEGPIDNLLASSDDWVAPVFSDIGPDENLWVADWHNPVIQHNPDRRGQVNQIWNDDRGEGNAHMNPLRDVDHGRIYVINYPGKAGSDITSLDASDPDGLLGALSSTNQFWRLTAQRLIVENQIDLSGKLVELVQNQDVDELGLNTPAIHALWTLDGLGKIDSNINVVRDALAHPSAAVRRAAIQILPDSEIMELISSGVLSDPNLNTRLAATLRVADLKLENAKPLSEEILQATRAAKQGGDKWIDAATDVLSEKEELATRTRGDAQDEGLLRAHLTLNASSSEMTFQQKELRVYEDQPITLTFNNLHPDLHNVVLLREGSDFESFGSALDAFITNPKALDSNYIPESQQELVINSTKVLSFGTSASMEVDALEPGEYIYICTVPGHWRLMHGKLIVEALN